MRPPLRTFIDEVSQMDDIVDRLLADWVTEGVEEAEGVYGDCQQIHNSQLKVLHTIRARVNSQSNFRNLIIRTGSSLGLSDGRVVGTLADIELIVVLRERLETTSLDLDSVVNVGTSVDLAISNRHSHVRAFTDAPGDTDRCG